MKKFLFMIVPLILLAVAIFVLKFLPLGNPRGRLGGGLENSVEAAATKTGLVGYWTLDKGDINLNNTITYDKSGLNNHGTMSGTTNIAGKIRQGRNFNGSSYISVNNSSNLNFGTADSFTVAAWFNTSASGAIRRIFSSGHSGYANGYLLAHDGTYLLMGIGAGGVYANTTWTGTSGYNDGKWHHVVAVFDRTENKHIMYVDGVARSLVKDANTCGTVVGTYLDTSACGSLNATYNSAKNIGRNNIHGTELWNGSIDELRIYNRALSAQEAETLYNSTKTNRLDTATKTSSYAGGLQVGYWTMDDADVSGTTLIDRSDYKNNATLSGTASATGQINQARSFNGSSDSISAPEINNYNAVNITVSAWVKFNSISGWQGIVTKRSCCVDSITMQWALQTNTNDNKVYLYLATSGGTYNVATTNIATTGWEFYTATYDGETLKIYRNGSYDNQNTSPSGDIVTQSGIPVVIGARADGGSPYTGRQDYFNGSIDEVRIFDYALSASEISDLYNSFLPSHSGQLVGYWNMDSGNINGTTYYDKSGFNRNATSTASPGIVRGKINQAVDFNGTTQYLDINRDTTVDFTNETYTASFWVNPDVVNTNMYLYAKDAQTAGYGMYLNTSGKLVHSTSGGNAITSTSSLQAGQWAHVALAADGAYGTLYINGILENKRSIGTISDTARTLKIGRDETANSFFNGKIDDFRIYNYAFSAQEAANLYNAAKINYAGGGDKTGLVGYWNMDKADVSGSVMYDRSGSNNNATGVGGTAWAVGKIRESWYFNGTGYANIANSSRLNFGTAGSFTITGWFRVTGGAGGIRRIFSSGHYSYTNGYLAVIGGGDQVCGGVGGGGVIGNATFFCTGAVSYNVWHHFAAVFERGTGGVDRQRIYVDTISSASSKTPGTCGTFIGNDLDTSGCYFTNATSNEDKSIGRSNTGSNEYFVGSLDDARIYNRALSAQEVVNLYNSARVNYK